MSKHSAAIIVTYNREPNLLQIRNAIIHDELDFLIISDNSLNNKISNNLKHVFSTFPIGSVHVIKNVENIGISKAINQAFQKGFELECQYFFLIDDDANLIDGFFSLELKKFKFLKEKEKSLGALCPIVTNNERLLGSNLKLKTEFSKIGGFITSGALILSDAIKRVDGYDESFFVEYADLDFSHRIAMKGYGIYRINIVLSSQDFGTTMKQDKLVSKIASLQERIISFLLLKNNYTNDYHYFAATYSIDRLRNIFEQTKYGSKKNGSRFGWLIVMFLSISRVFYLYLYTGNIDYLKSLSVWLH